MMKALPLIALVLLIPTGCREASAPAAPIVASAPALPLVIPTPKVILPSDDPMIVTAQTQLVIADDATAQDTLAATCVRQELAARLDLHGVRIVRASQADPQYSEIVFGEPERMPLVQRLLTEARTKPEAHAEGYVIRVSRQCTLVAGHDPAGTFYGAQTLCQLLASQNGHIVVSAVTVDDYPSLRWRGAHLFVGNQALPFHKRLIANVFARYKMNNLVLQCEQAQWDTLGSTAPPWAMSKADLKAEAAFARAHFMTVTPLIESVGHMPWLLSDPKRKALAEDPQTPYALNLSNPASDQFLFALYGEVLDTLHPDTLHIGGDEVTLRGRYPYRSRKQYPTVASAMVFQVTHLHDWLKARGIKTMLWSDMLLAPGEAWEASAPNVTQARQMRSLLPKDVILCDWHYAPGGDFQSTNLLRSAGFSSVIGATWYEPQDIAKFSVALAGSHQQGLLQTTWAGYNSNPANLTESPDQFSAFVLAAEEAWNGGSVPLDHLHYDPKKIFAQTYRTPLDSQTDMGDNEGAPSSDDAPLPQ